MRIQSQELKCPAKNIFRPLPQLGRSLICFFNQKSNRNKFISCIFREKLDSCGILFPAINRPRRAGFRHDDFREQRQFRLQLFPNPNRDFFARRISPLALADAEV
jgi:hypothetical protein